MKRILFILLLTASCFAAFAQSSDEYLRLKLQRKENLTVKEWDTDAKSKTKWLDRVTVYDSGGHKISETEYNQYGQSWRETYEWNEQDQKVRETRYNDKDKVVYVRKFEYNENGTRKKQYTYLPRKFYRSHRLAAESFRPFTAESFRSFTAESLFLRPR